LPGLSYETKKHLVFSATYYKEPMDVLVVKCKWVRWNNYVRWIHLT